MRYSIRHVTRFTYDSPITESVMEARMQPRTDEYQRCLHFALTTTPESRVMMYQDHDGNAVHHFDIPARHSRLTVTAEALVDCLPYRPLPHRLGPGAWATLDALAAAGDSYEYLTRSAFVTQSPALDGFRQELRFDRGHDPLVTLRRLMGEMYARFEYSPRSTRVDSPIDEALETRRGVCQDFAHIFLALVRPLGVPARYVSGYLFRDTGSSDRSADGATHAWVEVLLPDLGWVGFDPTNNLIAEERHVRVAIGRDYADVPPTRGVYKGVSAVRSELGVSVRVGPVRAPLASDVLPFTPWMSREADAPLRDDEATQQSQQ
jgi:transglutaminase-like putative cysteine protease